MAFFSASFYKFFFFFFLHSFFMNDMNDTQLFPLCPESGVSVYTIEATSTNQSGLQKMSDK